MTDEVKSEDSAPTGGDATQSDVATKSNVDHAGILRTPLDELKGAGHMSRTEIIAAVERARRQPGQRRNRRAVC